MRYKFLTVLIIGLLFFEVSSAAVEEKGLWADAETPEEQARSVVMMTRLYGAAFSDEEAEAEVANLLKASEDEEKEGDTSPSNKIKLGQKGSLFYEKALRVVATLKTWGASFSDEEEKRQIVMAQARMIVDDEKKEEGEK